ncbi:unnamed protein product [Chondrus crispus]|uniref:Uncharacterized protein n=1 Tax=Chondrus crispus TaxID=2769 RepID=R7Q9G3_CHOCR|nr:unnamed protein product [Chondrus crispus]CDF34006.1 unnamed protein product [Chondrus crispus]|eukprot:XP_005713825.1 unnamed protein product [Chondrus crispus]
MDVLISKISIQNVKDARESFLPGISKNDRKGYAVLTDESLRNVELSTLVRIVSPYYIRKHESRKCSFKEPLVRLLEVLTLDAGTVDERSFSIF